MHPIVLFPLQCCTPADDMETIYLHIQTVVPLIKWPYLNSSAAKGLGLTIEAVLLDI